ERLRAGVASIAMTPPAGVAMQGYELRHAEAVNDPLLASALAVGVDCPDWVLLSVDCIGLDREVTARVRQTVARRLGLSPGAVTVACSHTHSGPATLRKLGPVACDDAYLTGLEDRLLTVAANAAENLQPAHWRFGVTSLAENVNRRLRRRGRI